MSQYSINPYQLPKLLIKRPRWGLSRSKRKSAAALHNALRMKRTEIAPTSLKPFRHPWGIVQAG